MKKLTILFALLTLSVGLWAIDGVKYIDANGQEQTANGVTEITNASSILAAGWYVVKGNEVTTGSLTCSGAVHLILADGAKLTATGDGDGPQDKPGIQVSGNGNSLTIYGQTEQTGQLIAIGGLEIYTFETNYYYAGIGSEDGESGKVTINGGKVTASAQNLSSEHGDGINVSEVFVNTWCIVKADGNNPPTTVIDNNGGNLAESLKGKQYVTIEPAPKRDLTTEDFVVSNNIHVCNGEAKAATVTFKEGIIGAGTITVTYKYNGAEVTPVNAGVYDICAAVTESDKYKLFATTKVGELTILDPIPYIDENGKEQTAEALIINSSDEPITLEATNITSWYVVKGNDVTFSKGAVCKGAVHLILADGAKLTATGGDNQAGIQVSGDGNSLSIYGQVNQSGQLIANGGINAAGIGGGHHQDGSNITINGGKVTATGDEAGAGIGGGSFWTGGPGGTGFNITINAGTVTATGGKYGAGIGGGDYGNGSNITINGGTITANGGSDAAGIGGGEYGNGSNIIINSGMVTATSKGYAAGIGGGYDCNGTNITINGGTVTAKSEKYGAGIGGGIRGTGSNIIIKGGQVTANGGTTTNPDLSIGDGIGRGSNGDASSNILVDTWCTVKADGKNPPTTVIENDGTDLAKKLKGKQYATVESPAKSDLTIADIVISSNSATYNGEAQSATVAFNDGIIGAGQIVLTYKQGDEEVTPINAGSYDIYVAVTAGVRYNALPATKLNGQLTITKGPLSVDNFTYTAPSNTYYNGKPREAKVELNSQGKTGVGTIIAIKYNGNTEVPSAAGDYIVSIDVTEGTNYNAATGLTDDAWKFTIKGWPTPEPSNPVAVEIVKDGKAVYSVSNPEKVKYYKSDSKVEIIQNSSIVYTAENPEGVRYTHSYVDLGLPSGMLWAAYNIGATKPEEYGDYYAWGDPRKKTEFYWSTYPYGSSVNNCTKYHNDNKWTLEPEDDMATVNWGSRWRVPTKADFMELFEQCDTVFTTYEGAYGLMLISKTNGKTLFLPAAGNRDENRLDHAGEGLYYWSSSVIDYGGNVFWLQNSASMSSWSGYRYCGFSVRPVYDPIITLAAADFKLSTPTATYDGEIKEAEVSMADTKKSMPDNITIYYNNDKSLQPKDAGTYQVYIDIVGDNHYNDVKGLTSEAWKFTIEKATPTADMFTYTAPSDLYDNVDSHEATVTFNNQNDKLTGMGTVAVKYNDSPEVPTALGDYAVSISVAEGANYKAAEKLSDEAWKFTIKDFAPDGVEAVDLGLPSGLKWANVNVADPNNEALDGFFTWGDATNPDVATTTWGDNWRLPTKEEFQELIDNCTWEWVEDKDYDWGYNVSSKTNDNSIFLPAVGYYKEDPKKEEIVAGYGSGYYWSSSIDDGNTYLLDFSNTGKSVSSHSRSDACSVRPVLKSNGK